MDQSTKAAIVGALIGGIFVLIGTLITVKYSNGNIIEVILPKNKTLIDDSELITLRKNNNQIQNKLRIYKDSVENRLIQNSDSCEDRINLLSNIIDSLQNLTPMGSGYVSSKLYSSIKKDQDGFMFQILNTYGNEEEKQLTITIRAKNNRRDRILGIGIPGGYIRYGNKQKEIVCSSIGNQKTCGGQKILDVMLKETYARDFEIQINEIDYESFDKIEYLYVKYKIDDDKDSGFDFENVPVVWEDTEIRQDIMVDSFDK